MKEVPARPTLLEVDVDAAAHNVRAVRQLVGPERKIFAVIKAGGYGFGAAEMGAVFARNGADWLGVADLAEGIRLRQRGISTPVLVYPNSLPSAAPDALANRLVPTLVDLESARAYSDASSGPCDFFVKVDVGLERLGVPAEQAVKTIRAMLDLLLGMTKAKVKVEQDPARMRPSDVPVLLGDAGKFQKATGWTPTIPFETTLRDLLEYWRAR